MLTGRELIEPIFIEPPHPACLDDAALLRDCDLTRGRTGGPGGQHRNKVATLVTLVHRPTSLFAHAGERRSPEENRRVAVRRLRILLAVSCRAPVRLGEIGSDLWRSRVRGGRIALNHHHRDRPAMLAEALDVLYDAALDPSRASLRLECSASQLIKLIAAEPGALDALNRAREARKLRPLRR
ncbi:MAG: peptide chain release factor-like protein [Planctomycetota bacterium]